MVNSYKNRVKDLKINFSIRICQFDAAFDWLTVADENRESCPASYFQAMSLCWRAESDLVIFRNRFAFVDLYNYEFDC